MALRKGVGFLIRPDIHGRISPADINMSAKEIWVTDESLKVAFGRTQLEMLRLEKPSPSSQSIQFTGGFFFF